MTGYAPRAKEKMKCGYCGRTIRRGGLYRMFTWADGKREPLHAKCDDWVNGRIGNDAFDIKEGG